MQIHFRQAQPADCSAAVPLIYASGPHEFDYVFHEGAITALDYLAFVFPTGRGLSSYHRATVAVVDNEVVGIYVCHSSSEDAAVSRGNLVNILRCYGLRAGLRVLQRALRIGTVLPPPTPGSDYISQLGVSPSRRGQGIGTRLLQRQCERSRELGRRALELDVAAPNHGARRLYERLGFRVIAERAWKYGGDVPDQQRMELKL